MRSAAILVVLAACGFPQPKDVLPGGIDAAGGTDAVIDAASDGSIDSAIDGSDVVELTFTWSVMEGATGVSRNADVIATPSRPLLVSTVSIAVLQGGMPYSGFSKSVQADQITIKWPGVGLAPNTSYKITIAKTVSDVMNNHPSQDPTLTFITGP